MTTASARASPLGRLVLYPAAFAFLVVLAVSRYEPTSLLFRGTTAVDAFSWFWRHRFLGLLSFFDLFLGGLAGLILLDAFARGRWRLSRFDPLVAMLLGMVGLAVLVGLLSRGPLDGPRELLFQLRNFVYLAAMYFVASRLPWTESRFRMAMALVVALAVMTILLGQWEISATPTDYRVAKAGRYLTIRDIADVLFIVFAHFWLLALLFEGAPRSAWGRLLVLAAAGYALHQVLTDFGKTLLFVYPMAFAYLAWHHRLHRRRWFPGIAAAGALLVLAGVFFLWWRAPSIGPGSPIPVYATLSMSDLSVATRVQETRNFFANLYDRSALLQGIGLGSKWYEYVPQPWDFAAYPPSEHRTSWHLGMHMPLLRLGLDFGIAGLGLGLALCLVAFRQVQALLRTGGLSPTTRAFVQACLLAVAFQIAVNNLAGPKTNLLAGFMMGSLGGMIDHVRVSRALRRRWHSRVSSGQQEKILFLSPWNPYPPLFGARLRVLSLLQALAAGGRREVHLLALAEPDDDLEESKRHLSELGIKARLIPHRVAKGSRVAELPTRLAALLRGVPYNAQLFRHPALRKSLRSMLREHEYGVIVAETSWMGQHAPPLPGGRRFLSWQNVDFDVYARRALGDANPIVRAVRWYNYRVARQFEMALVPRFDGVLTVTEGDRRVLLEAGAVRTPVHVVPICVDTVAHAPAGAVQRAANQIVFVGAMFYEPNVDAVTYFQREIYGRVRERVPGVRFVIVGRDPVETVRRLAQADPSVSVTGTVDDVSGYYRESTVFVAPIRYGGGMKTKIVEAMAAGLPVVATSFAMEGIEARDGEEAFITDDPERFAARVVSLLEDGGLREKLARAGRELVERTYSWDALALRLDRILEER